MLQMDVDEIFLEQPVTFWMSSIERRPPPNPNSVITTDLNLMKTLQRQSLGQGNRHCILEIIRRVQTFTMYQQCCHVVYHVLPLHCKEDRSKLRSSLSNFSLCSQYLIPLGLACVVRGMGTLYISSPVLQCVVVLGAIYLFHCPADYQWLLNP